MRRDQLTNDTRLNLTNGGLYLVIPDAVASDVHLRERPKLIYGRIVQLAASTGFCYATNKALLRILTYRDPKTGVESTISERTLQNCLAELKKRGYISMDTGTIPCGDGPTRTGRRIWIGQTLAPKPSGNGGEKNCGGENFCAEGVKISAPPFNSMNNTREKNTPISPNRQEYSELFERFWELYPRKADKGRAWKAWKKLEPDMELFRTLSEALDIQKRSDQWRKDAGKYIPHAATWLNGHRWEDELGPVAKEKWMPVRQEEWGWH